jgi:hypothetical protein
MPDVAEEDEIARGVLELNSTCFAMSSRFRGDAELRNLARRNSSISGCKSTANSRPFGSIARAKGSAKDPEPAPMSALDMPLSDSVIE